MVFMADYQAMYAVLFRKITAVIEELQNAQRQTEEMYISSEPPNIRVINTNKTENIKPDTE
jgi:hypothetical protein